MISLAIETSCDETSIAILKNNKVLSNVIHSQIKDHQKFFGVIPELAARLHLQNINVVYDIALKEANIKASEINYIFFTKEPGLPSCLQVGKVFAETLSWGLDIPCLGINHLHAHLFSANIEHKYEYPFLGLVVSGGHTAIYLVNSVNDIKLLTETRDDAAGECFDKVAKLLKLNYPGGPEIDKLAKSGNPNSFQMPTPKFKDNNLDFSFSGLKSFMANYIKNNDFNINDACATFQKKVVSILLNNLKLSYDKFKPKMCVIVGGVSCNSLLRKESNKLQDTYGMIIKYANPQYCTDNAAMVGFLGYLQVSENNKDKKDGQK